MVSTQSCNQFEPPILSEGSGHALHLESVLQDLPLHRFQIELDCLGSELACIFERYPLLPGAILLDKGRFVGMVSRQRLLEYLIRPHGSELFLSRPLWVLHSYVRCEILLFLGEMSILMAAQQALRRSPEFLSEPVVVRIGQSYHLLDIHALNIAHWQIRGIETQVRYERTQAEMIQSDKMANLGRLVDGVAHEILDPVSFIWGNLSHIATYTKDLLELLATYEQHVADPPHHIVHLQTEIELDYLREDLPRAIGSVKSGAERLSKLATSLQNFCHIDEVYPRPTNLHELIDNILLLLKSRLTSEIQVVKHYSHLPPVLCYPGQLNQVLMNILSIALDSLLNDAVNQQLDLDFKASRNSILADLPSPKPTLEISTHICSLPTQEDGETRWISICITDNGPGLSAEAQQKIQESFSVKRRAEKETSLAVSYQIITAKHGGKFRVRSRGVANGEALVVSLGEVPPENLSLSANHITCNTGTEFEILLPLS